METTGKEMEHRYQTLLDRAKSGETSKAVLQDEYSRVQDDLARQEGVVAQLEQKVHEERAKREQELEEMQVQLEQEQKRRADEVTKCSKVISELKEEFKSKASSGWVKGSSLWLVLGVDCSQLIEDRNPTRQSPRQFQATPP